MANLFQSIASTVQSWFSRQQTSQVRIFTSSVTEVYPDINQTTAITKGFNSNTAVYSIVRKAAKKFGAVPRYVEPKGQEGKEVDVLEGDLMDLLNRPNEYQGQDAFFSLLYAFYKVCGESFIWLNRGDTSVLGDDNETLVEVSDEIQMTKPVLEMFIVPANRMIVVPDPENIYGVFGYILESSVRIPIRKTDIIHWKDINLNFDVVTKSHLRGWSGLASGYKSLEANNSATDATVRMNQNGGAKKVLANKTLAQQSPTQQSQLEKIMETKINNNDVKGAVSALQGDWSGIDLGMTSVDMDLLKGKMLSMQELCFLMGMPYEFFDSQVTYANKAEAQKGWIINEIMPDCKQLDGEMSRVLLKAFRLEKTATICSDFDDLPELQEDKAKQAEWLMKAPVSSNEFREAIGYDPSDEEGTDDILIPSNMVKLADLGNDGGDQLMQSLYNGNSGITKPTNGVKK